MRTAGIGHGIYWPSGVPNRYNHLAVGGEPLTISVLGKDYFFEWHRWCGPMVLHRKTHDPRKHQPSENSPFWQAVQWWFDQGRRVDDNGFAVWTPEEIDIPIFEQLDSRNRLAVGYRKGFPPPFDEAKRNE